MKTLSRSILVLACLLSLIGLSGCEQAEEAAKKAGGELMTQAVDKAQQAIKEMTGSAEESKDKGKKEDAEPTEEKGKKKDAESAEEEDNQESG